MAFFQKRQPVSVEIRNYESEAKKPSFFKEHTLLSFVLAAVAVIAVIFVLIFFLIRKNTPVNCFISASSKTLDTSFSYQIEARQNGESVMRFGGMMKADADRQTVEAVYDADYRDYQYRSVTHTEDGTVFNGSYYNGQWTVQDATVRTRDFFDFYTDFRRGELDAGSLFRFMDNTSNYSSVEAQRLWNSLRIRLSTDNPMTHLKVESDGEGKAYIYRPDVSEIVAFLEKEAGPVFLRASDYNDFVERVGLNEENIEDTKLMFRFTVSRDGYLTALDFQLETAGESFEFTCEMSDFGTTAVEIPDDFLIAVGTAESSEE